MGLNAGIGRFKRSIGGQHLRHVGFRAAILAAS
jgi:hypothetical protein